MLSDSPQAGGVRVLMVARLFHPWIGGTERQAHKLARALLDSGVDARVVTGWWFRGTPGREVLDGVEVHRHSTLWEFGGVRGLRKFGGYLYIVTLLWHLWTQRSTFDVLHVHGLNYHAAAAVRAGRWLGKPVVVKLANSGPASDIAKMREDRQLALARLMLPTALRADRFVALNAAVVRELEAAGVPGWRVVQVPNGVDTTVQPRSGYTTAGPLRIVYVGRLHPQKGLDTLLRAVAKLLQDRPEGVVLQLVGDGPSRAKLEALADELGISPWVEFAGARGDIASVLQGADAFVLPSRAEGLSNALLEAMAHGLPVVVSDIDGNRDVIRDGHNGLHARLDDPEHLSSQLGRLFDDEELRARLGRAARAAVEAEYSLAAVAARYGDLYRTLIGQAGTAPTPSGAVSRSLS